MNGGDNVEQSEVTDFDKILNKFYMRIEKDEDFFNYYNVSKDEAIFIARQRAQNYLMECLDKLSGVGGLQVDFSNYNEELETIFVKLYPKEIDLLVEMMFLTYMKRDEALLHAMEINFSPSDLTVFSPGNERTSYRNFIKDLSDKVEAYIDNYKNRDRLTGELKKTIDYSIYNED